MFNNRSKVVFISAVLGSLYVLYTGSYFAEAASTDAGGVVATAIVMPHLVANFIAVIFNWIAFAMNKRWAIIVALVLYCVAIVLFPIYFLFDLPMVILSAVGISKIKKVQTQANPA